MYTGLKRSLEWFLNFSDEPLKAVLILIFHAVKLKTEQVHYSSFHYS
jgi:hypothetical protein